MIVGGCCVLVAIFRHFGFDECLVSEADILDGLVYQLHAFPSRALLPSPSSSSERRRRAGSGGADDGLVDDPRLRVTAARDLELADAVR